MRLSLPAFLIGAVVLSATAQILLKAGVSTEGVQAALATGSKLGKAAALASSPLVFVGLVVYGLSAALWLLVLARVDVTYAYPFVGLGFLLTMMFGVWFLGETLTPLRLIGTCLVALGVVLIAQT
jgi:multidrug transporter EmrE-like cation transporter